ncbi:metallophosphoesterase family protein [Halopenitus persicus]|uniref:Phosphoesterase n=1 Tax=Halopenitus persicus TaxID=1048396 RepID=A0A1H3JQA6_9EURY|nr:metallophosphoesterase family protein [Halopenitus persicus]QHS15804.1 metallophosphoesterase family protein [haloarchaeon 3A1-DGR]SDY41454.1 phosphoesterase, MJ0936 family [Halopenitus persicus]
MRVGLIADVHANLPALEAVWSDMPAVDAVVCAGDVVGYNPWPAECVERVREIADAVVVGNHDRTVDRPHEYAANRMAEAGLEHAKRELTDAQREWLADRPRSVTVADGDLLVVHDHPTIQDKYVYPSEFPALRRHLDDYRGLVLGHTHVQHRETVDGRAIVNPGSVGQPRDGDPRAAYAVLETDPNVDGSNSRDESAPEPMTVDLHRVEYDVDRVVDRIADVGLPERTGSRLRKGE